ncbi:MULTISPECIES: DUF3311 domain-containing protein [Nocardioides]|uniref:DUF3311 domain-containing protein n=1 Tax=Nocardioides vastitatis TaxID=2568655 RepID=A0ABW0ZGX6_9ACTN|nr:DUF3311 domain-containing protein [Nocardioides sp.]THJ09197.1 DUF3311 domain-containing protein [Nocardioides sp.]
MSTDEGSNGSGPGSAARGRPRTTALLVAIGLFPVAATLAVPLYARVEPRIAGIPFFYWYQFACLALTGLCLTLALVVRRASAGPARRGIS